jgi:carboxyl-terminal processing protease
MLMRFTKKPEGEKKGTWGSRFRVVLFTALIFMVGVAVGDGRIAIGTSNTPPQNASLPAKLDYDTVDQLYQSLKANYDGKLTQQQLEDGLKHGLANAAKDPYTVYFTPKEAADFASDLNQSFSGIGAQLGQDKDGNLEVVAPIDGLPADKAGVKAKDIITDVNGTSTSGMSVDDAVSKIRGPKGTKVTLKIVRDRTTPLTFTIVRDDIKLPSVKTKTLDNNIGYIQITTFAEDTAESVRKAAQDLKAANVKGVVLDMRSNPGGVLDGAVDISSVWLPSGKQILQEKQGSRVIQTYSSKGGTVFEGVPTVVLIDAGSASASEIVTGALRDNKAAYVIGEKSYGKGVVQQLINFRDGSQLKVTVASWYRPNGQNINKKGITPDKTVKISDEDAKAGKDTQLEAAQAYLNK